MSASPMTPPPLLSTDPGEMNRITTTARRVRMLGGVWKEDARRYIAEHFAREALDVLPPVSIERNPYRNTVAQLATLYDVPPEVSAPSSPGLDLAPVVTPKLRALWPQLLINVIGLNEALIRVDVHPDGRILYRVVTPDQLRDCKADPYEPDRIVALSEVRYLTRPGFSGWGLERWDVSNPDAPVFKVYEQGAAGPVDATALYYPDLTPGEFPYRDLDGRPVLPFALYHLRPGGALFNPQDGEELVEATLGISMLTTSAKQGQRDLAYPQRAIVDGELQGVKATADQPRVTISPLGILQVRSTGGQNARLDQWQASYDPVKAVTALDMQEASLSGFAGLTPADMNLSAASSGAARVISKEGLRRVRLGREQAQRFGDLDLLTIAAKLHNRSVGFKVYPESPDLWQITYLELAPLGDDGRPLPPKAPAPAPSDDDASAG